MSNLIKIQGEVGLFKDTRSGGIVASNAAYARYKSQRDKRLRDASQQAQINRLEREVSELRSGMNEILSILRSNNGNTPSRH